MQNYKSKKHTYTHIYTLASAYAVIFWEQGECVRWKMENYKITKHTNTYIYTLVPAYAVVFF